jgi:predicted nuclease of predicted toxin-antitoxin system
MAHFLIDASLPRATADVLRAQGHTATDVRDIGLTTAPDRDIADHAQAHQMCLVTGDGDFGNVLAYPPGDFFGLVVITPPTSANKAMVLRLVEGFVQQTDLVDHLAGRLFIVEVGRIRSRPPL